MCSPGSLVLQSELFSHVVTDNVAHLVCDLCLARPDLTRDNGEEEDGAGRLDRCSGCRLSHYCGAACQRRAWPRHRAECRYLQAVSPRHPPSLVRLMARTLDRVRREPGRSETGPGGRSRTYSDLMTHRAEVVADESRMEAFSSFRQVLLACEGRDKYSDDEMLDVYCKILINSTEITDIFGNTIGTGLYLGLSAVDHSCRPNVSVVFSGRRVLLRATETIAHPDNARISYLSSVLPTKDRQRQLSSRYYFTCDCSTCLGPDIVEEGLLCVPCGEVVVAGDDACKHCHDVLSGEKRELAEAAVRMGLDKLSRLTDSSEDSRELIETYSRLAGLVSHRDWRMVMAAERAMAACLVMADLKQFVEIGRTLVEPYERFYSAFSSSLGLHLMKLGKGCLYNRDYEKADQFLKRAGEVIRVSHGEDHSLYQYLVNIMKYRV